MADVMTDFNIRRGLSTVLFSEPGVINPDLLIEEGCWYLCTDTAELFLGVQTADGLTLKRINEKAGWDVDIEGTEIDAAVIIAMREEVKAIKENLKDYAKTSDIPSLEEYATKEFVVDAIDKHEALATVEEVKTKLETEVLPIIPTVQETILPTVQKVETEILPAIQELTEKAATQEWVQEQSFATETFVDEKISEIEIPEIPAKVSELENDAGYITLAEVPEVDLSIKADKVHYHDEYAQKDHNHDDLYETKGAAEAVKNELLNGAGDAFDTLKELGDLISSNKDALSALELAATGKADKEHTHEEYALKAALESLAAKTDIPVSTSQLTNDSGYITLSDIPEVEIPEVPTKVSELENDSNYATTEDVATAISKIKVPETDLTGFATKDEIKDFVTLSDVETQGYLKEQDLADYAKIEDLPTDYLTEADLDGYSKFSGSYNDLIDTPEIPSIAGLASEEYVDTAISSIKIPSIEGLATEDFVKGEIDKLAIPEAADLSNYYNKEEINAKFEGIEHPQVSLDGYATEVWVAEQDFAKVEDIPALDNFATKDELAAAIDGIKHPTVALDNYVTKDEIKDFITEVPSEYITEEELNAKGYITDVSDKANVEHTHTLSEIIDYEAPVFPSLEGYATEQFVTEAIAGIKLPDAPEVNLDNYYTKSETDAAIEEAVAEIQHPTADLSGYALKSDVEVKANNILFTTDKYVTNAFGGFAIGDSIKGLELAQILTKLLGLSDSAPSVDPDTPPESDSIIENIINNKLPMYSIGAAGGLDALTYDKVITYTNADTNAKPDKSGFYQVVGDNGEIIESGYQDLTIDNPNVLYIIALPKEIDFNTMVTTQVYDDLDGCWKDTSIEMSSDAEQLSGICGAFGIDLSSIDLEKYTLWVDLTSGQGPSGKIYRFIINE